MLVAADGAELAEAAARWIASAISESVRQRGAGFLALSGGETPRATYARLGQPPYQGDVPWRSIHIFWADERRVPLDDPQSNYAVARAVLLDRVPVPAAQIHPMPVEEPDPSGAATAYARVLERVPRNRTGWPRFDLILLGLGEDGHTASLFPGDAALSETRAPVRAVRAVRPPAERLTFTLPVINAARGVVFLVSGAAKRSALQATRRHDPSVPAGRVQPDEGELLFIVDREALGEGLGAAPGGL